jgi:hypothetical protein
MRDAAICRNCTTRLRGDLCDVITSIAWQLDVQLARQATAGRHEPARRRRREDGPLPYDPRAVTARDHLASVLWAEIGQLWPDAHIAPSVVAMAGYLLARIDELRRHPHAPDTWAAIIDVAEAARWVIDPHPPERRYAGPCSQCGSDLYAQPGISHIACRCGATHSVEDRKRHLLEAVQDHLATATEAARLATWLISGHVTPERIRKWAQRKRLTARGTSVNGAPLYLFRDVLDLIENEQKKAS